MRRTSAAVQDLVTQLCTGERAPESWLVVRGNERRGTRLGDAALYGGTSAESWLFLEDEPRGQGLMWWSAGAARAERSTRPAAHGNIGGEACATTRGGRRSVGRRVGLAPNCRFTPTSTGRGSHADVGTALKSAYAALRGWKVRLWARCDDGQRQRRQESTAQTSVKRAALRSERVE